MTKADVAVSGEPSGAGRRRKVGRHVSHAAIPLGHARAQGKPKIRIGMLTDMTSTYRDLTGPVSILCGQQAVKEWLSQNSDFDVEVVTADFQQKADIGSNIARQWFDREGVDVIEGLGNSAVSLAVTSIATEKDKAILNTAAGSSDLTGKACSPNLVHWTYDSWCLGQANAASTVAAGGKSWFFITPDYTYGHSIADDTARAVVAAGGTVAGKLAYPFPNTNDFASFLLQAGNSGAQVLAFGAAGADLVNCVKQTREFGLDRDGRMMVGLGDSIVDVLSLGLPAAQGLRFSEPFYWDLNPRTRAFMDRIRPAMPAGRFPGMDHAGSYAAILHYLKAVKHIGPERAKASGRAVIEAMKALPTDDDCFGVGSIRKDGRKIHDVHSFVVKLPNASTGPGDLLQLVGSLPADRAFRPLDQGGCPFIRG